MEPEVIEGEALRLIGVELRTRNDGSNHREIPAFWERALADGTLDRIPSRLHPEISYGLCTRQDQATGEFSYVIGAEVDADTEPPEGYQLYTLPSKLYAVFTARGRTEEYAKAIQATWRHAYEEWIPSNAAWERDHGDVFELYDAGRMGDEESECDIYIPVRPMIVAGGDPAGE